MSPRLEVFWCPDCPPHVSWAQHKLGFHEALVGASHSLPDHAGRQWLVVGRHVEIMLSTLPHYYPLPANDDGTLTARHIGADALYGSHQLGTFARWPVFTRLDGLLIPDTEARVCADDGAYALVKINPSLPYPFYG